MSTASPSASRSSRPSALPAAIRFFEAPAYQPHPGSLEHDLERLVDPDHGAVGVRPSSHRRPATR